jgi:hypothetical protein
MPRWAIDITAGTGGFEAATKRISASQSKAAKQSSAAWSRSFKVAATASVGIIAGGIAGFKGLTQQVIDYRNELTDAAARTGLQTDTLQALRLQAEGTGQDFGSFVKVVEKIPKLMADANNGLSTATRAFDALDVEIKNADGTFRDADSVLRDIVSSLGDIKDPTTRAAMAMDLFGRSGGKALQAFSAGAEAFEQHERIAKRFGVETGPEAAEAASRMQEEMARMGLVARGAGDDLWTAFGGDDGAVGGLKLMTSSLIIASDLIVELRKNLDFTDVLTFGSLTSFFGGEESGATKTANAIVHARDKAVEYLAAADQHDRTAAAASSAMAAFNDEIQRNGKVIGDVLDPQEELQKSLATIAGISADATRDLKTEAQLLTDAYIEQTEPLLDLIDLYGMESEAGIAAMEALRDADERLTRDKQKLREEEWAAELAQRERDSEDYRRRMDERIAMEQRVADAKLSIAGYSADAMMALSDLVVRDDEQGNQRGVALAKTAGISKVIVDAAGAVMGTWNAYADIPFIGPALAAAQTALIGGIAVAQGAKIATAYEGIDIPYASPLGTPVIVHPGESVVDRTKTEQGKAGGSTIVRTYISGQEVATTVEEQTSRGGPLQRSLDSRYGRLGRSRNYRST